MVFSRKKKESSERKEALQALGQRWATHVNDKARELTNRLSAWQNASPRNMRLRNALLILFFALYTIYIISTILTTYYGTAAATPGATH